jgi:hypothetical protein
MEPEEGADPFNWDEARVIQELWTPNRSWEVPKGAASQKTRLVKQFESLRDP